MNFADAPFDPEVSQAAGRDLSQRMTVPVHINGVGPFNFVVDSGANRTVVCAELAAELRLPDGGPANIHGVAGVEPAPTAMVQSLLVGNKALTGLRAPTLPRARLGADGLLGVDALQGRRVVLDFLRDQLTIAPSRAGRELSALDMRQDQSARNKPVGKRVVVPARYRFGQLIIIGADVERRPVTAFLDTGAQATVGNNVLRKLVLESRAIPNPLRYEVPVLSATGQTAAGELRIMPQLKIGGLRIKGLMAVFADLHVFDIWGLSQTASLLLGMDVLRRFNAVELDYGRREVAFYLPA